MAVSVREPPPAVIPQTGNKSQNGTFPPFLLGIFISTGAEGAPNQSTDAGFIDAEAPIVTFLLLFDFIQA